jgi:hypothetical protein
MPLNLIKNCNKCGVVLDDSIWNKSNQKKKNYICLKCNNQYKKEWCWQNPEKTKASVRERMRKWRELNPEKAKEKSKETYYNRIDKAREYSREYSKNNRIIKNAQLAASYAVKRGIIEKQPCKICGDIKVEKHHPDYSKKTDIEWLCPKHHHRVHKWIN